jgi:hypothetical protein
MQPKNINEAVTAARIFIKRWQALVEREAIEDMKEKEHPGSGLNFSIVGCKETAAFKRASLDLSRALSKMRRP